MTSLSRNTMERQPHSPLHLFVSWTWRGLVWPVRISDEV